MNNEEGAQNTGLQFLSDKLMEASAMKKIQHLAYFAAAVSLLCSVHSAYAEDCSNFSNNPNWQTNFEHLQNEIFNQNYEAALESAKTLFAICPRSPAVNYYSGVALRGLGDEAKATMMFQKASEYTTEFSTSPEMSRLIWYARYEGENPNATSESQKAVQQKVETLEAELESVKLINAGYEAQLSSSETLQYVVMDNERDAFKRKFKTVMWTGTAVGAIGLVSAITGGVLAFTMSNDDKYKDITNDDTSVKRKYKISSRYGAGLGLFGAGLGLTAAGALMAGFGGYHYTHSDLPVSFRLDISPNYAGVHMTF